MKSKIKLIAIILALACGCSEDVDSKYARLIEEEPESKAETVRDDSGIYFFSKEEYDEKYAADLAQNMITLKNFKLYENRFLSPRLIRSYESFRIKLGDAFMIPSKCFVEFDFADDQYIVNHVFCPSYDPSYDKVLYMIKNDEGFDGGEIADGISLTLKRSNRNSANSHDRTCRIKFTKTK